MDKRQEAIKNISKQLKTKTSYQERLSGLKSAENYDLNNEEYQSLKDIVINISIHDKVFAVKKEAFRICQKNNLKYKGKKIKLGRKNIGYKVSDVTKMFKSPHCIIKCNK